MGAYDEKVLGGRSLRDIDRLVYGAVRSAGWLTAWTKVASVEAARDAVTSLLMEEELARRAGEEVKEKGNTFLFTRARWTAMTTAVRTMNNKPIEVEVDQEEGEEGDDLRMPPTPDHADELTDRLAVRQVMARLRPDQQRMLGALADSLDLASAAERLGISASTLSERMKEVRRDFIALWFDGETPPEPPKYVSNRRQRWAETGADPYASRRGRTPHNAGDGVTRIKRTGRFMARCWHDGRSVYLGVRASREDAARLVAECKAAHREEQPAESSPLRTQVGCATQHRMAVSEAS